MPFDKTYTVRTPEQVSFRYALAGPAERTLAYLLDFLCIAGIWVATSYAILRMGEYGAPLLYVIFFLLQWGYFLWFEWRWNGATPGKRMLGLRVMQMGGVRCSFERLALRNFLRVVDFLPFLYAIGGAVMLLSRRGARLGDLAAGTVCVRVPRPPAPSAIAEIQTRFNSLNEDAAIRARIRQLLTPQEAALITSLALRRELLEDRPRLALFARTASYLRGRLRLAGHESIPDESLVLNVASVLLSAKIL